MTTNSKKVIRFLYDVQCPYAYLASKRVVKFAEQCKVELEYFPVLLGGLYDGTKAPQGKDGSATDVMALAKRKVEAEDLQREVKRWGAKLNWNSKHPVRSVYAQRLLVGINEQKQRAQVTNALFDLYWQQQGDVSDEKVLMKIAQDHHISREIVDKAFADKDTLRKNTEWAVEKGVFGVPTFFVIDNGKLDERFFFGGDRMHFLAQRLGLSRDKMFGAPLRLYPTNNVSNTRPKLEWFHDFSSPWSFLSSTQIERIANEHNAELVPRPILLGALFKSIGTPNVPMFAMSEAKRSYFSMDMEDWKQWWGGIQLTFPQGFPIRTVNSLRIAIAEPKTTKVIYQAAWVDGLNVGDDAILSEVLRKHGFDAEKLIKQAKEDSKLKDALIANTKEAMERGACGVPTFSVEGGPVIWGQDRFHVVEDELEYSKLKPQSARL